MKTFTRAQRAAIESAVGCTLIVAGPGAGKTSVLMERVVFAITNSAPEQVVVITFTNAAADEIMKRLRQRFVETGGMELLDRIGFIGTLHAYLIRQMFRAGKRVAIIGDEEHDKLLDAARDKVGYKGTKKALDEAIKRGPNTKAIRIDMKAAELVAAEYWRSLRTNNLMTYDAVLHFGLEFIRKNLSKLDPIYDLLVDECQDSGPLDFEIYRELGKAAARTFFVGDPDQSIYGFRGADVHNIVALESQAHVIKLEENFRSDIAITHAANALIKHNRQRIDKMTISAGMRPGLVEAIGYAMPRDEFAGIVDYLQNDETFPSVAILVRTRKEVAAWTEVLETNGFVVRSRKPFDAPDGFDYAKVTLKFMANPENNFLAHAFLRAKHNNAYHADTALRKALAGHKTLNADSIHFPMEATANDVPRFMAQVGVSQPSVDFTTIVLSEMEHGATIAELAMRVTEAEMTGKDSGPEDGITVATIHGAKGREWDDVYLPGWCANFFPKGDEEEERRLAFVALTRARHYARITYTMQREREFKGMEATGPSKFIGEALPAWKPAPVEKTFTDDPMPA